MPRFLRFLTAAVAVGAATALAATAVGADDRDRRDGERRGHSASALLRDGDGDKIGVVRLHTVRDVTRVRVRVSGASPGFHGFHVHETGRCEPPFTSAGGHLAGGGDAHGAHAGDLPPLLVTGRGRASAELVTDRFTVAQLLDGDGSAFVLHAGPDNLAHIPERYRAESGDPGPDAATRASGDAGDRQACGVVRERGSRHRE